MYYYYAYIVEMFFVYFFLFIIPYDCVIVNLILHINNAMTPTHHKITKKKI